MTAAALLEDAVDADDQGEGGELDVADRRDGAGEDDERAARNPGVPLLVRIMTPTVIGCLPASGLGCSAGQVRSRRRRSA
ncbi:hypothetical protein KUF83_32520 [Streptomyces sp. BV286]|uniref:hypothetical protein n=1 Tax=Streptomyces sp. BV286 TaxID=2849672 RepID=UPI001C2EC429|nr:hypothetical protein [Streptomyces sp. BV286]MBV1941253.1 hypothetical protein [Streptomyces sp. BV286]